MNLRKTETMLKLDFDGAVYSPSIGNEMATDALLKLQELGYHGEALAMPSSSGFTHIEIMLDRRVAPIEALALQVVLGSDIRRESFNLQRVERIIFGKIPAYWRKRWNVLYQRKLS